MNSLLNLSLIIFLRFIHVIECINIYFLLLMKGILLHKHDAVWFSVQSMDDMWVASSF